MCDDGQITNSERKGTSMTNETKATKQLSKALAVLMTIGSLIGITAVPALASDSANWNLEVTVYGADEPYDPCIDFVADVIPASWAPDPAVNYTDPETNTYDVYQDDGLVAFNVSLAFAAGSTTTCNGDPLANIPDGTVVSTFAATTDPNNITVTADCDVNCNAMDLYQDLSSVVNGTIDVTGSLTNETRTGVFTLTWTPAD